MLKKTSGYTLIELLLVIAIIAVITSLGILAYRHKTVSRRIEKASLEMQNLMEAAVAYNADHSKWPDSNDNISTCSETAPVLMTDFIKYYVPNADTSTNFGSYYCWGLTQNTSADNSRLFWVAMKVHSTNKHMASRIAALLPNAVATLDPKSNAVIPCGDNSYACYVRAEVAQPIGNGGTANNFVAGVGNCLPHATTNGSADNMTCRYLGRTGAEPRPKPINYNIQFHCPTGMTGNIVATLNFLNVGRSGGGSGYKIAIENAQSQPCTMTAHKTGDIINCLLKIHADVAAGISVEDGIGGHAGATYTAYCLKQKKKSHHWLSY